jgi:hypothetical protein
MLWLENQQDNEVSPMVVLVLGSIPREKHFFSFVVIQLF